MFGQSALQKELAAQLEYAADRHEAWRTTGQRWPKTRAAKARQLASQIRRTKARSLKPRLRYRYDGSPVYSAVPGLAVTEANFGNMNDIIAYGGGMRRRKRRRRIGGRGAYYAHQVSGRGNYLKGLRRGAVAATKWARKNQKQLHNIAAMGASFVPGGSAALAATDRVLASGIGTAAGNLIEGKGSYEHYGPLFTELNTQPRMQEYDSVESLEYGNLIVTGQEKIADIFGNELIDPTDTSDSSPVQQFQSFYVECTPGNFEQFPKLAQHAANFEEYEWVQLVFTYKSTLPDNYQTDEVNTGNVTLAPQYNLKEEPWFTNEQLQMRDDKAVGGIMDKVNKGMECDDVLLTSRALKPVRTRGLTPDEDQKDYDLGRMFFGMFGTSRNLANKMIGELWVYYKVHFKTHRRYTSLGYNIPQSLYYNDFEASSAGAVTWTANGSGDNPPWKELFNFKQQGISRELCYNNLEFELERTQFNLSTTSYRYDGLNLKFTFPSSLSGNYEIEVRISGTNMLFSDESTDPDAADSKQGSRFSKDIINPTVEGTCLLNNDIQYNGYQVVQINSFAERSVWMMVHVHLEQATGLESNTLSFNIPFLRQAVSGSVQPNNYVGDGDDQTYNSATLSMKQYNSYQHLGAQGLPYKDSVTNDLIPKQIN